MTTIQFIEDHLALLTAIFSSAIALGGFMLTTLYWFWARSRKEEIVDKEIEGLKVDAKKNQEMVSEMKDRLGNVEVGVNDMKADVSLIKGFLLNGASK